MWWWVRSRDCAPTGISPSPRRDEGPERARPWSHHLLNQLIPVSVQLLRAQQAEDDTLLVDDDHRFPAYRSDAIADLGQPFLQATGRCVLVGKVSSARPLCVRAFGRKSGRHPVELAHRLVVDLTEAEALEPPRGPWKHLKQWSDGFIDFAWLPHAEGPAREGALSN